MEQSEQQKFLEDLDIKVPQVLEKPLTEEVPPEKEETDEETETRSKNRRERRLLEQNQRLREEAIAASARAQALSEVNKFREEVGDDHLKEVEAIYGTDTPEKLAATNILKKVLSGLTEKAKQETLEEIDNRQSSESKAVLEEEDNLDDILDHVEDEHGIDMSGDDRTGFLTLLEKISPKDRDGNIIEFADPDATAELYLSRKEKSSSRAKDLASRSMTHSGASSDSKLEQDSTMRFLKENGII